MRAYGRGGSWLVGPLVLMLGLAGGCFGTREVSDSATLTFVVENRTEVPLVLVGGTWLAIEWGRASLTPRGEVRELCDVDDPIAAFDRLGLPPPGAHLPPGKRFEYAWQANAFTAFRCDPGWSDCSECQIAEPVPLGRRTMTICAYRTDFDCDEPDGGYSSLQPDCRTIEVVIGEEDRTVEVVIDTVAAPRCSGDGVLTPL